MCGFSGDDGWGQAEETSLSGAAYRAVAELELGASTPGRREAVSKMQTNMTNERITQRILLGKGPLPILLQDICRASGHMLKTIPGLYLWVIIQSGLLPESTSRKCILLVVQEGLARFR